MEREGMQLHFHISCHIAHLGWETPVFLTLFTFSAVYISRQNIMGKIFGAHLGFSLQVIHS
jgi:hypothetical protein